MLKIKNKLIGKIKGKEPLKGKLNNAIIYVEPLTQEKVVIPNTSIQEVTPDENYTGLSKVTVNKIPEEYSVVSGTLEITEIGTHDVKKYESVNVNINAEDTELVQSFRSTVDNTQSEYITKLPDGIKSIRAYTFYNSSKLKLTELSDEITAIYAYAFYYCENMLINKLPDDLKTIGSYAFYKCSKITVNRIPLGVTTISEHSFRECLRITSMDVHDGVTKINSYAFRQCPITTFIVRRTTPPTLGTDVFFDSPIAKGTGYIYVPDESIETYKTTSKWSSYANQIKGISELPT